MTIRELRWLLKLQEEMSFTKAADALYTTQSSLSQCLQRVEAELGFALFERSRRHITVTEKGMIFLTMSAGMVRDYDACLQEIYISENAILDTVTIGVTPYVNTIATDVMSIMKQEFPQVRLRFLESNSDDLVKKFEEGTIQILSTNVPIEDASYHKAQFGEFRLVILLRRGSPAEKFAKDIGGMHSELDPIYLKEEPLAITAQGSRSRRMALDIFQDAGINPEFVQEVTRPTTLCTLAKKGEASSIYAYSGEVEHAIGNAGLVYQIPQTYSSATGHRYLLCRKSNLRRLPEGYFQTLVNTFTDLFTQLDPNIMIR